MYKCEICDREFKSKRSLISHKNHHNPTYHEKSKSGYKALTTETAKASRKKKSLDKSFQNWQTHDYHCIVCDTKLEYPSTKTCSDECHSKYRSLANTRIVTEETKQKIRQSQLKRNKDAGKTYVCKHCNTEFASNRKTSWCSPKCAADYKSALYISSEYRDKISRSVKLAFLEGRHKGNEYRNRKNNSYLENSFIEYLKVYYPTLIYVFNKTVKISDNDGNFKNCYYIDFYFPKQNIGIELDGSQHLATVEYDTRRDREIFEQHGIVITRITYHEYFSKEKKEIIDMILEQELKF